ncbi:hypothetical protein RSAG8_10606, partial [Rhizoctonia solani AG-8 WAC10335]
MRSSRSGWAPRRPSMPTTPSTYDDSDPFNRYAPESENDGYEVDMRPIVIPPPPYEHVWKDIYAANSAAYRLRTALLESKRVDDVLAITKAYPPAISARFLLHEHLTVTANTTNGAGLFPPAPGTTISTSTVPTTPALTAASTADPDFPTTALNAARKNILVGRAARNHLKESFLLLAVRLDLRKEYFGRALVLEYRERGGNRSGFSSREDSRERPERGFAGGFVPPGSRTPGAYAYEEARGDYGYPKPGDFVRPGLGHRDSAASAKSMGNEVMLVTNGADTEEEAMLNEDSLLCLVEDVDGACDALGEYADNSNHSCSIIAYPNGLEELANKGLDAVDSFMQVLRQDVATGHPDSPRFREALIYLWNLTGHYPAEKDITNEISRVGKSPIGQDAVSFTQAGVEVVRESTAMWLGVQPVAIRYLRAVESPSRIRKRLKRDIDTWRTLFHPNIHTFISCVIPRHGAFGLVVPILRNGNVIQYLLANPGADRTNFVIQAAEGLRYLHEEAKLVHGDFRGVNLLVSDDGMVMITGYGILPAIERNQELGFPEWGLHWGDARWMAPELHHHLNPKTKFPGQRTTQSDVYAFACTALEIWTSAAPFAGHPDANVVLEVANKGRHPPRPQNTVFISKSRSDQVWGLLQACWNLNPGVRPSIRTVLENLSVLAE